MAEFLIQGNTLTAIANAIREKTKTTGTLTPQAMASKILEISGGGGLEKISTEAEMDAILVSENLGKMYQYVGSTNEKYYPGDIYIVEEI